MDIRLYRPPESAAPRFTPVAITDEAATVRYTERFFTYGDFEITIHADARAADAFQKYLLVLIDNTFRGIIRGIERTLDSDGDVLTVSGLCLKGLTASRRTLPPNFTYAQVGGTAGFDAVGGTTEYCIKHLVRSNFFTALSPTRTIPGLFIAPDKGRGIANDKYMTRYDELHIALRELGEAAGIGYTILPELATGALVFDCVEGVDRSGGQSARPRVIFSVERGNIESMSYQDNDANMRNLFYTTLAGARFEDEAYTATYTRDDEPLPSGLYRWEQHLEISATHPEAGREYDEMKRLALIRAQSYQTTRTLTASVLETRHKYGADFALGDIVTVKNKAWGLSMDARIAEVTTDASSDGVKRNITFGEAPLNFVDRLKRQIRGG